MVHEMLMGLIIKAARGGRKEVVLKTGVRSCSILNGRSIFLILYDASPLGFRVVGISDVYSMGNDWFGQ